MSSTHHPRLQELAEEAARAAGEILLERWQKPPLGVRTKSSDTDPASDADRAAEVAIITRIRAVRPDDAIVAEEGGLSAGKSGVRWLIDPLDGTVNYLYGIPQWSVSICALEGSDAVAGVVFDPVRNELFTAARGAGAWCGDTRLGVGDTSSIGLALMSTGFSYLADERAAQADKMVRVAARVRDLRRFGSAALDLAWVAAARVDGYYESDVQEWDIAAGGLIVTEAGGAVTRLPTSHRGRRGILASNRVLHTDLLRLVT